MAFVLNSGNIAFPDGSTQSSVFADSGPLLGVSVFTSNGYWRKPAGATK